MVTKNNLIYGVIFSFSLSLPLITLEKAFNSTFHDKFNFEDFLSLEVDKELTPVEFKNKSFSFPSNKLKKYLVFLNHFVFNYASISSNVHSYRKGRNIYTALEKHQNSQYFFKTDIANFFDSITKKDIKDILDNNLSDIPIKDIEQYKNKLLSLVCRLNALPVGFPTSPNISNTLLYKFDNILNQYCLGNNIIYTRYSDDIILSANVPLIGIEDIISQYLLDLFQGRLKLNESKTKYVRKGEKIKLLGLIILPNGKISIDIKTKKQLEVLFHFYINDKNKFDDYLIKNYKNSLSSVSGQLHHINTIDKSYLDKLRKKYGNFIVDGFFNKSIK